LGRFHQELPRTVLPNCGNHPIGRRVLKIRTRGIIGERVYGSVYRKSKIRRMLCANGREANKEVYLGIEE
jgi:hypothetical protein